MEPQVDTEQAPHDDEACQLYVSHAGVEHDAEAAGFLAASHLEASALAPLAVLQSTVRVSVPVEPQTDVEQDPQDEECQLNVAHAGVEHDVDVTMLNMMTSLVAALHLEAAAAAPLAVLPSKTRV